MQDEMNAKVIDAINTQEFLTKVEEAARNGAMQGSKGRRGRFSLFDTLKGLILLAFLVFAGIMLYRNYQFNENLKDNLGLEKPVDGHDLTLENHGILGYTAADFQEAILGDSEQLKKLEVYKMNVSDVVQLTDTGLANLKIFSKTQLLTYKGIATYTVDLGKLTKEDITLDEAEMIIHVKIPHAVLEPININEEDIEFGDVKRGLLGIGKMEMQPEDSAKIQKEARAKMTAKLNEQKVAEEADRFAKLSVWEIYQPIIDTVTTGYSLEVEME